MVAGLIGQADGPIERETAFQSLDAGAAAAPRRLQ
jgi:hypothetical protein